jgi:hypothetical protein
MTGSVTRLYRTEPERTGLRERGLRNSYITTPVALNRHLLLLLFLMATSQPIALPHHSSNNQSPLNQDYIMGSYSGETSGSFNPASYTRHFLGSPISWRAGSFGARFPQGSPTAQLLGSIEYVFLARILLCLIGDYKAPTTSSTQLKCRLLWIVIEVH